jgi:hypothetical protein
LRKPLQLKINQNMKMEECFAKVFSANRFVEVAQQMQAIDYSHHKLLKKAGLRVMTDDLRWAIEQTKLYFK